MKTKITRLLLLCAVTVVVLSPSAFAQRQLGKKKGPTSKLYIAENIGEAKIKTGDRIYSVRQASAFDAPGTVIETSENSRTTFVYSNGVGMTVGANTRVEINRFEQEAFSAKTATGTAGGEEPSVSQSEIYLSRGSVGISTSQFLTGSSMSCSTDLGFINIRGGNIKIESNPDETIIDLLDGAATVQSALQDGRTYTMQAGQRIILRRGTNNKLVVAVATEIPPTVVSGLTEFLALASNARKTVTFEVIEKKAAAGLDPTPTAPAATTADATAPTETGTPAAAAATEESGAATFSGESDQEIVPKPTVPANLPTNVVISADRLPGG